MILAFTTCLQKNSLRDSIFFLVKNLSLRLFFVVRLLRLDLSTALKYNFRADFWPFSDVSIFLHLRFLRRSLESWLAADAQPLRPASRASCVCWSIRLLSLFAHRYRRAHRVRQGPSNGRKALVESPSWNAIASSSHVWVDRRCCCRPARADAKGLVLVDPCSTTHFLVRANFISTHSGHVRQLLLESLLILWN